MTTHNELHKMHGMLIKPFHAPEGVCFPSDSLGAKHLLLCQRQSEKSLYLEVNAIFAEFAGYFHRFVYEN
ncbi:unnamed protein product [Phytomonas sp. Hart1]|nr:unnamed protein product [Phytomonas sp. Hart1]|eukprot:CCW67158.1 unnamed protein product [Phytomonas sp. isolate Hart1]